MAERDNTVAVLVAKVSTSVEAMMRASEGATQRDPMDAIHAMMAVVKRYEGEVQGVAGDGVLARFTSVEDAVDAGALIGHLCEQRGALVTIGICTERGNANAATSGAGAMLKLASPGQMIACESTVDRLTQQRYPAGVVSVSTGRNGTSSGYVVRPKPSRVIRLVGDYEGAGETSGAAARTTPDSWIVLEYGGARRVIREGDGAVIIGRSPRCHIHVKDSFVSRRHCSLRIENGRALIEDSSSGGCWIWQPRHELIALRQREMRLPEGGIVFLGYRPVQDRQPQQLSFLVGSEAQPQAEIGQRRSPHRQLLRARSGDRMALSEFPAMMRLPDGATQLPVEVVDLGTGGVGLLADCPLGTVSDVMRLVLDRGGASIQCELRHVGRRRLGRTLERWLHGAAFLDVDEQARAAVLEQLHKSR